MLKWMELDCFLYLSSFDEMKYDKIKVISKIIFTKEVENLSFNIKN